MITGGDADGREVLPVEVFAHLNRINAIFFNLWEKEEDATGTERNARRERSFCFFIDDNDDKSAIFLRI